MRRATDSAGTAVRPAIPSGLVGKVESSSFYQTYRNAFQAATGLPLSLRSAAERPDICPADSSQTSFCRAVNSGEDSCRRCVAAQKFLLGASRDHTMSVECFAGLKETAVPLKFEDRLIAFLLTGQVLTRKIPTPRVAPLFQGTGRSDREIGMLLDLHRQIPVIDRASYKRMISLLIDIRNQLAVFAWHVMLENRTGVRDPVRVAMEDIMRRIHEPITSEGISRLAGVSRHQLDHLFRRSTGVTVSDYIERQRIELAKCELLRFGHRLVEVTSKLGFRSYAEFSHSFEKIVGQSPNAYRTRMALAVFPRMIA